MYELMSLAFKTDSTRVATFALAPDGDNRSFGEIGIPEGHHDLSHHQNNEERIAKIERIDRWYSEHFAKFLQSLEDTRAIDGNSVLHNTRIVYGSGSADANRCICVRFRMSTFGYSANWRGSTVMKKRRNSMPTSSIARCCRCRLRSPSV